MRNITNSHRCHMCFRLWSSIHSLRTSSALRSPVSPPCCWTWPPCKKDPPFNKWITIEILQRLQGCPAVRHNVYSWEEKCKVLKMILVFNKTSIYDFHSASAVISEFTDLYRLKQWIGHMTVKSIIQGGEFFCYNHRIHGLKNDDKYNDVDNDPASKRLEELCILLGCATIRDLQRMDAVTIPLAIFVLGVLDQSRHRHTCAQTRPIRPTYSIAGWFQFTPWAGGCNNI